MKPSPQEAVAVLLVMTATQLEDVHGQLHIALSALKVLDASPEVVQMLARTCNHFEALDDMLKHSVEELVGGIAGLERLTKVMEVLKNGAIAPNEDMMSDAEYHRAMGFTD